MTTNTVQDTESQAKTQINAVEFSQTAASGEPMANLTLQTLVKLSEFRRICFAGTLKDKQTIGEYSGFVPIKLLPTSDTSVTELLKRLVDVPYAVFSAIGFKDAVIGVFHFGSINDEDEYREGYRQIREHLINVHHISQKQISPYVGSLETFAITGSKGVINKTPVTFANSVITVLPIDEKPKLTGSANDIRNSLIRSPTTDLLASIKDNLIHKSESIIHSPSESNQNIGLFKVLPAANWIELAKQQETPKMLFDSFWFEGELCILFAEANQGKSILAVQIADAISKGEAIKGAKSEAASQKVLLLDFELSAKQFENRYSIDYKNHYTFDSNLIRIEMNPDAEVPNEYKSIDDYVIYSLEKTITETGARVIIVDNITYLKTDTESAKDAAPLMKGLKALKSKFNLSLLVLAHTPKRDPTKPLTRNDVQGSSRLGQFADAMFAIGASSRDSQMKYLKQVKVRSSAFVYDSDNVIQCQIHKPGSFLMFEMLGFSSEREHLKQQSDKDISSEKEQVRLLSQQGKTQREIAAQLGLSQTKVNRILNKKEA